MLAIRFKSFRYHINVSSELLLKPSQRSINQPGGGTAAEVLGLAEPFPLVPFPGGVPDPVSIGGAGEELLRGLPVPGLLPGEERMGLRNMMFLGIYVLMKTD